MNSIAIIVKHMAGNMRSRWTDFLTTDGEKPDRNRDSEFEDCPATREALMRVWEDGWAVVFGALEPLTEADLGRTVTIRGEAHSVMQAINRQLAPLRPPLRPDRPARQAFRQGPLAVPDHSAPPLGNFPMSIFTIVLVLFGLSQLYWGWRFYSFAARRIASRNGLLAVLAGVVIVWMAFYTFTFGAWSQRGTPVSLTLRDALLVAPFLWWVSASVVGFLLAAIVAIPQLFVAAGRSLLARRRRPSGEPPSPDRRRFLARTAAVAAGAPFVAGAYGMLYGRLNLETTAQKIHLPRLPRAFEGFRICQLSDIHIGPFMPAGEIRKYVAIANQQKADMIVLTGDFVTFDAATQYAVVDALRGLQAPFGIYGCLGNHDAWAGVEDSITELFRQTGVRMLRGAAVPVSTHGESFNLIGVDFRARAVSALPRLSRTCWAISRM